MFAEVSIDYWGTTEVRWGQGGARNTVTTLFTECARVEQENCGNYVCRVCQGRTRKLWKLCLQSPVFTEEDSQEKLGRLEDYFEYKFKGLCII